MADQPDRTVGEYVPVTPLFGKWVRIRNGMFTVDSSHPVTAMLLVLAVVTGARAQSAGRANEQSKQTPTEAREITYKEAYDMLTAFLKVNGVEQSGEMGYKEYYFFMANMGSSCDPGGTCIGDFQYYAVDRRTGDVWSSVICERIATRALTRLQAALRKRIGLTNAEYGRLKRLGPMCEPGMPRIRSGK